MADSLRGAETLQGLDIKVVQPNRELTEFSQKKEKLATTYIKKCLGSNGLANATFLILYIIIFSENYLDQALTLNQFINY